MADNGKKAQPGTRTLRSVPPPGGAVGGPVSTQVRTDAADKLWQALQTNPNCTATDLAEIAAIGRSTAGKILARWATAGTALRTPGIAEGGGRAADLWSAVMPDGTTSATKPNPDSAATTDTTSNGGAGVSATSPARDRIIEEAPTEPEPDDSRPAASRLAPGALRGMVEDFLRAHSGQEFSPTTIGKQLGRSAGAVHNALEKLAEAGYAERTSAKPKRFRATRSNNA